jgi:hypothetical protein
VSTTTATIANSTGLGSPRRTARGSSKAEWARGIWTGRSRLGKAAVLEKASGGGQRNGCARGGRMRVTVGKGYVAMFFFFGKPRCTEGGAEEVYWARSLDRPGICGPDGTRLDGRPCAHIIATLNENKTL